MRVLFAGIAGFLLVMAIALSLGLASLFSASQTMSDIHATSRQAADLRGTVGEMRYSAVRYIFGGEPEALERTEKISVQIVTDTQNISDAVYRAAPEVMPEISSLQKQLTEYNQTFSRLGASLKKNGRDETSVALAYELATSGDALYEESRLVEASLSKKATGIESNVLSQFFWVVMSFLILGIIALASLFFAMRFISDNLTGKISEVTGGMTALASGRYDFEIAGEGRRDEIGAMVRAMNVFKRAAATLKRMTEEREELRQRQRQTLRRLADGFERNFGEIVNSVASASTQLKSTAGTMEEMARKSTKQTEIVTLSIQESSVGVNAAAAASDQFARSIEDISARASSSAELARKASNFAHHADETISALSTSADEIGAIVGMIQSIAKRTNLLALNASIEASRGADAGRGFAVVASEIKELAARTSRATDEIADKIRSMQNSTGDSVKAIRNTAIQINDMEATAASIAAAVDQQALASQDLARSIDLTARTATTVTESIGHVHEAAVGTGAASTQVLMSSDDLEKQGERLKRQLVSFLAQIRAD